MSFTNTLGLERLDGVPTFHRFWKLDRNPVSGLQKRRQLYNPNDAMRSIHRAMNVWIASRWMEAPSATACFTGCSTLANAQQHQQNRYFYTLDLKSAYDHVDGRKLAWVLCSFDPRLVLEKCEDDVFDVLQRYFLIDGHRGLPTGGPSSPHLFNHYVEVLIDRDMRRLLADEEITYTRYLDDLTFSSLKPDLVEKATLRRAIRKLITPHFAINHRKCDVCDITKRPVEITGIGIRWKHRLFLPRRYLTKLRGSLHMALRSGTTSPRLDAMIGIFRTVTDPLKMTRVEQHVMKLCRRYKQMRKA